MLRLAANRAIRKSHRNLSFGGSYEASRPPLCRGRKASAKASHRRRRRAQRGWSRTSKCTHPKISIRAAAFETSDQRIPETTRRRSTSGFATDAFAIRASSSEEWARHRRSNRTIVQRGRHCHCHCHCGGIRHPLSQRNQNYNSCHSRLIRIMVHDHLHWAEGSNAEPMVHACCRPAISRTKHVTDKTGCETVPGGFLRGAQVI